MMDQEKLKTIIQNMEEKYGADGQDINQYLEGFSHFRYLDYWDYISLDALLGLQNPRTNIPDENIFIIYHQITELYFKLCLLELEQLLSNTSIGVDDFIRHVTRINNYFRNLVASFDIMVEGMQPEQFLKFRLSLLPASGFQSAQYRLIEMACTKLENLVDKDLRAEIATKDLSGQLEHIYWRAGAMETKTGNKTLTLKRFEKKYWKQFTDWAKEHENSNVFVAYNNLNLEEQSNHQLIEALRQLDKLINIEWPMVHMKSASKYLGASNKNIPATGGTNWTKYLPPRFQFRVFFPMLWSDAELGNWGRE